MKYSDETFWVIFKQYAGIYIISWGGGHKNWAWLKCG